MGGGDFINVTQDFMMSWNKGAGNSLLYIIIKQRLTRPINFYDKIFIKNKIFLLLFIQFEVRHSC